MYIVYGEHYENDYIRENFEKMYFRLEDLFEDMKRISHQFNGAYGTYIPQRKGRTGYGWCGRIELQDYTHRYHTMWIYKIDCDNGTVYSNGKLTDGNKFCSKNIERWLNQVEDFRMHHITNFVED